MKHWLLLLSLALFLLTFGFTSIVYANNPCETVTTENPIPDADCLAWIATFPAPLLEEIPLDRVTLNAYDFWRVGPQAVNLYDTPNGSGAGQIAEGFNFVRAVDTSVEGWIQAASGLWLLRSEAQMAQASHFRGVLLSDTLEHPFAWVVDTTGIYTSEYPGGPSSAATGRIPHRYELVNIFAEVPDNEGWLWYLIGPNQWVNQRFVAVVKPVERPEGVEGRWAAVDLYEQTLVAYEDDTPVFATLVATGLPGWDTNEGIFTVWARLAVGNQSGATGAPDSYALESVPWIMYFDGDISFHGAYWHDLFGYRRSHGCVNLSISDARYLFEWTGAATPDENGDIVTYVYVYSSDIYIN
ncbi:L,D-transpeptidase [Phototrophicus methaneseepsis]|uniref:L,D-transpeptidase n=1 Tax=Phototrophicus methaneseepsis TaxID=2710758 RepID=A0A7S8EA12_9CHLR|nr:L,D-transpeptidase [Phototrophicus methaneseepsis]QPC83111.1 L,D-transpeptidase [Phototrophicus methaneseepsis]